MTIVDDPQLSREAARFAMRPAILRWRAAGEDPGQLVLAIETARGEENASVEGMFRLLGGSSRFVQAGNLSTSNAPTLDSFSDEVLAELLSTGQRVTRDAKGRFAKQSGNPLVAWNADFYEVTAAIRAMGRPEPKTVEELNARAFPRGEPAWAQRADDRDREIREAYEAIGRAANDLIERHPDVEAALAEVKPYVDSDRLDEYMAARARVTREVIEAVRPTGTTTGLRVDTQPWGERSTDPEHDPGPGWDDRAAATEVADVSAQLPAGWIRAVNAESSGSGLVVGWTFMGGSYYRGRAPAGESAEIALEHTSENFVIGHELIHAVQESDPERRLTAASQSFYRGLNVRGLDVSGEPQRDALYDRYALKDYRERVDDNYERVYDADELTSTGFEYLLGGNRADCAFHDEPNPFLARYRASVDFVLGQVLAGGPPDTPDDYREAGIEIPEWLGEE